MPGPETLSSHPPVEHKPQDIDEDYVEQGLDEAEAYANASQDIAERDEPGGIEVAEVKAKDEPLRIVLTSLDQNVDNFAREAAHEKIAKKHEGPAWKRVVKSVWGNLTREFQVVKATQEARQEIRKRGNLLHYHGKSDEQWRQATVERYGSEYGEALVREEYGETFHKLGAEEAEGNPNAKHIRDETLDLLRKFAKGEIDTEDDLRMMQERMVDEWREEGISQQYIGEGEFLAHNIGDMARQVKAALDAHEGLSEIDREAKLEEMLENAEIVTGEARVGSRVEIEATASERIAEKLKSVPFLNEGRMAKITSAVANETVVAAMVSAGVYAAKRGAGVATAIVAPGLAAGVIAGIRERRALLDERALSARRLDAGQEIDPDSKAQAEIDASMYESRNAGELIDELGKLYNDSGELKITDRDSLDEAMRLHAEIRARITISDRTNARLINFADNGLEGRETRGFDLDLAMAKLEVDLKRLYENPAAKGMLDITDEETFEDTSFEQQAIHQGMLAGEMQQRDRLFNKLMAKRIMKRVVATTVIGSAVAVGFREGTEAARDAYQYVREHAPGVYQSAAETSAAAYSSAKEAATNLVRGDQSQPLEMRPMSATTEFGSDSPAATFGSEQGPATFGSEAPAATFGTDTEQGPATFGTEADRGPATFGTDAEQGPATFGTEQSDRPEATFGGESEPLHVTDTAKVNLPEGYTAEADGNVVTLTTPDGQKVEGIEFNQDGTLTSEAQQALRDKGFEISATHEIIQGKPEIEKTEVGARDFVANHRDEMVRVKHTKWFDNNTSKFDLNELGLRNNMDSTGNVVISVKGMTAGRSFNGASGINWMEAAQDGHLKVYLSASEGTQSHAFEVAVRPDGTAVIEKDSPAAALFNSEGKFIGGFQEVALNGGQTSSGAEKIATLATVVGESSSKLTDTIETPTYQTAYTYTVTPPVPAEPILQTTPLNQPSGPTPFVTATPRRNLGEAVKPDDEPGVDRTTPGPEQPTPSPEATPDAQQTTTEEGDSPAAEGNAQSSEQETGPETVDQNENFTPGEMTLLSQIDARPELTAQNATIDIEGLDLSKFSPRARKIALMMIRGAKLVHPRQSGEAKVDYDERIVTALHVSSMQRKFGNLTDVSPALNRLLIQEASPIIEAIPRQGPKRQAA